MQTVKSAQMAEHAIDAYKMLRWMIIIVVFSVILNVPLAQCHQQTVLHVLKVTNYLIHSYRLPVLKHPNVK